MLISPASVRRVVFSIIRDYQDELLRQGRLSRAVHIDAFAYDRKAAELDRLPIDETTLGLDSLSLLDLVARIDVFFGLSRTGVEEVLFVERSIGAWVRRIAWHLKKVGQDAQITFATSGSTGRPKHIRHSALALQSETKSHCGEVLHHVSRNARALVPLPLHHIYGFIWGVLVPECFGMSTVDLVPGALSSALGRARSGDVVLATPFMWDRAGRANEGPVRGVIGVTSGGPATEATWDAAERLGLQALLEIYGSSETGGVGWRQGRGRRYLALGDVRHRDGYISRPGLKDVTLPDRLTWYGENEFVVHGRIDGVLQVGGMNVDPERVTCHLASHPEVADAAVRLDGDRLKAYVVPRNHDELRPVLAASPDGQAAFEACPGIEWLEADLRLHLNALPAPARPDRFTFGSTLPRSATGKIADW